MISTVGFSLFTQTASEITQKVCIKQRATAEMRWLFALVGIRMKNLNQFTIAFSVSLSKIWILLGSIATLISSPDLAVDLGLTLAVSGIPSQRR